MDRHRRTGFELDGTIEAASIAGSLGPRPQSDRPTTPVDPGRARATGRAERLADRRDPARPRRERVARDLGQARQGHRPTTRRVVLARHRRRANRATPVTWPPRSSSSVSRAATVAAPTSSCRRDPPTRRGRSTSPFATMLARALDRRRDLEPARRRRQGCSSHVAQGRRGRRTGRDRRSIRACLSRRPVLAARRYRREPPARCPLPGDPSEPIPGIVGRLGPMPQRRIATSRRGRDRMDRPADPAASCPCAFAHGRT